MGTFDTFADQPFGIKTEGESITLAFRPGVPASGQGTISWNVPVPDSNCNASADGRTGSYNGIVVAVSDRPFEPQDFPKDGQVYWPDPTFDKDLHAGDKIGRAMVVGAFYEAEKKGKGQPLTTSFVVNNVKPDTPYYIAAFAVDAQNRYHTQGVRAYSDRYCNVPGENTPSYQMIKFGEGPVLPTDGTGLIPGFVYETDILVDDTYPNRKNEQVYNVRIDGINAGTYADLVAELNKQFAALENPEQSPVPPNTGKLYWDSANKKLFQFDGTKLVQVEGVLIEASDPSSVTGGEYWYVPSTKQLFVAVGSPSSWDAANVIEYANADARAIACSDYWFDGVQVYNWNGTAWCEVPTVMSVTDPACAPADLCGTFWYDEKNLELKSWNVDTSAWDLRSAIVWPAAPNALATGTYWFNLDNSSLSQWNGTVWNPLTNLTVSQTTPIAPAPNRFWFNPATEELKQWNAVTLQWVTLSVLVWPGDPTDIASCDLWWRSTDDTLFAWDVVNLTWTQVKNFVQGEIDPRTAPSVLAGTVWFNTLSGELKKWDGASWVDINVILNSYDPTAPVFGDAWYNTAEKAWYVFGGSSPGTWIEIETIDSEVDPTLIPNNTYWFNTSNNGLYIRSGTSWVAVGYSTSSVLPKKGQLWLNIANGKLYKWSGDGWVESRPFMFAEMQDGMLKLCTREASGGMNLMVLVPGTPGVVGDGYADFGYYDLSAGLYRYQLPPFPPSHVTKENWLFNGFTNTAKLQQHVYGTDAVSREPSYLEVGVGTDGSPDERRQLMDSLRMQLGYPTVNVELTKDQMDLAVSLALKTLRQNSSSPYKKGYFFLDVQPRQQNYVLSNRQIGYHKITNVLAAYRFTSAFLSSAHGAGVYGQVVLQHLYNMGTFDLTSYHLTAEYIEQMEQLFATRLTFHWHEASRTLSLYNSFVLRERVLLECMVERTEQELIKDRVTSNWIRGWALAEAKQMLAQIRGKYGSLPGAGGGISLNASDLQAQADQAKEQLMQEIEDFLVNEPEDVGIGSTFVIG